MSPVKGDQAFVDAGYCDSAVIERQLRAGGFTDAVRVDTIRGRSRSESRR